MQELKSEETMPELAPKRFCCLTCRSAFTWVLVFFMAYAAALILVHLGHLEAYQGAALFGAMGVACLVNFAQNRTFHCMITGPFFFLVALGLALKSYGVWNVNKALLWPTVLIVVGIAFLIERRVTR
jgi:hypothetical protein